MQKETLGFQRGFCARTVIVEAGPVTFSCSQQLAGCLPMNQKDISRRMLLLLATGMVSEATLAKGGGRVGRGGRGGRGGGAGGFGFLILIGGVFSCFWLYGKIFGRKNTPSTPSPISAPSTVNPPLRVDRVNPEKPPSTEWEKLGLCPSCGSAMKTRTAKRGRYAGRAFYGCTAYPYCNGTRKKPLPG